MYLWLVVHTPYCTARRSRSGTGNWSEKRFQFSSPTWFLKPCSIWAEIRQWACEVDARETRSATYFIKHLTQVIFRIDPRCHRITKKYEILNNPLRIVTDHCADTTKRRVLFFVVTNIAQWCTPSGAKEWVKHTPHTLHVTANNTAKQAQQRY